MDLLAVELPTWGIVVVLLAAGLGGVVQSALGFGAAFTVVPALALAAPELLPGAVLVGILPLSLVMILRDRAGLDLRAVGRLMVGRLPGIVTGAAVVSLLPTRALTTTIAVLLLAAVAVSAAGLEVAVTPRREIVAGYLSGLTGTAAALGGPPLALLYRSRDGAQLRPTLAAVWAVGLVPAIGSLTVAGEFTLLQLRAGGIIGVAMVIGVLGGAVVVRHVAPSRLRVAVLWWAGLGGLLALGRAIVG